MLHNAFLRVEVDNRIESLSKKIAEAREAKIPEVLVIGDQEVAQGKVMWQSRSGSKEIISGPEFLEKVLGKARRREC
ncbi:Threonine--tRNA ligase 1 [compost metagenome]